MEGEAIFGVHTDGLLIVVLAICAAVILGLIAQPLVWWLLRKSTGKLPSANIFLQQTAAPARYILPLLFLQFVWLAAPNWEQLPVLVHATRVLLIIAVVWLAIRCISAVTESVIAARPISAPDNRSARRIHTQAQVISRSLKTLAVILGFALVLMTFPGARALGTSLLASAGLAGIIAGVAARPVLSNLIAGMQIALSQPFHIDDVLIVEGEWGRVEEITSTYVSLKIWDERRLVIPLQWFIENPFQNWTRVSSELIGGVFWWVDYRMPLHPLRERLQEICENADEWDGRLNTIQVTDVSDRAVQIRALVTAQNSGNAWDLRCKVRESLVQFMQENYPEYLPRQRNEVLWDKSEATEKRKSEQGFSQMV